MFELSSISPRRNLGRSLIVMGIALFAVIGIAHATTTIGTDIDTDGTVSANTVTTIADVNVGDDVNLVGDLNIYDGVDGYVFLHTGTVATQGDAAGWSPDSSGYTGVWLEGYDDDDEEAGGFFANSETAAIWSPGDTDWILGVFDEDDLPTQRPVFGVTDDGGIWVGDQSSTPDNLGNPPNLGEGFFEGDVEVDGNFYAEGDVYLGSGSGNTIQIGDSGGGDDVTITGDTVTIESSSGDTIIIGNGLGDLIQVGQNNDVVEIGRGGGIVRLGNGDGETIEIGAGGDSIDIGGGGDGIDIGVNGDTVTLGEETTTLGMGEGALLQFDSCTVVSATAAGTCSAQAGTVSRTSATIAAGGTETFTVTNTEVVGGNAIILPVLVDVAGTGDALIITDVAPGSGSFTVTVESLESADSITGYTFNFLVLTPGSLLL